MNTAAKKFLNDYLSSPAKTRAAKYCSFSAGRFFAGPNDAHRVPLNSFVAFLRIC